MEAEREAELPAELIKVFMPMIEEQLISSHIVHDLAAKLSCVNNNLIKKIRSLEKNGNSSEAVVMLIDCLLEANEDGWFQAFKESLKEADYDILYSFLELQDVTDTSHYYDLLQLFFKRITQEIIPSQIVPYLYGNKCLNKIHKEEIEAEERTHGPSQAATLLLLRIHCCSKDWYHQFLGVLNAHGYEVLAKVIDPDFDSVKMKGEKGVCDAESTSIESFSMEYAESSDKENLAGTSETGETSMECEESKLKEGLAERSTTASVGPMSPSADRLPPDGGNQSDTSSHEHPLHVSIPPRSPLVNEINKLNIDSPSSSPDVKTQKILNIPSRDVPPEVLSSSSNDSSPDIDDDTAVKRFPMEGEKLSLRSYQKELAQPAIRGENIIICSPTGSGKTHVALEVSRSHLDNGNKGFNKVLFLVNKVPLVNQQFEVFTKYLSKYRCGKLHGEMKAMAPFKDLIPKYDIFVMTAQILVDSLKADRPERVSLSQFTLMIFDECHHTNKGHPYNQIMGAYLDMKTDTPEEPIPQVVGLTASLGVGKAKNEKEATNHIMSLCANLDTMPPGISTVTEHLSELMKHVNIPVQEVIPVERKDTDPFTEIIQHIIRDIENRMWNIEGGRAEIPKFDAVLAAPPQKGCDIYTLWVSQLRKPFAQITDPKVRRQYMACLFHLKEYNVALIINNDCRMIDALNHLEKEFSKNVSRRHFDETEQWLEDIFKKQLSEMKKFCESSAYKNPKLEKLKEMLLQAYHNDPNLRGIIFVKTRDLTVALQNWINETPELKFLNPERLTGAGASVEQAGMTQTQQVDVLEYFRDGKHKVVIATSVAEEGLDIKACNIVIKYDHVTNEIAMVQARGRGRAADARYLLVAEAGKGAAEKEQLNLLREAMMHRAMRRVQEMSEEEFCRIIHKFQEEGKLERFVNKARKLHRPTGEGEYELRCFKCDSLACLSTDIRTIEETHHVIIDPDARDRIEVTQHEPTDKGGIDKTGKIYCKRCHFDWGIEVIHKQTRFFVIKIVSFVLIDIKGNRSTCKKWKKSPFPVKPISHNEIKNLIK